MATTIHRSFTSVGQHVDNPRPILRRAADLSLPEGGDSVPVVLDNVRGRIALVLDRGTPFRMSSPGVPTNHHAAIVTVRTLREAFDRALNGKSSAGRVAPDLGGWRMSREAVNSGLSTRFSLTHPNLPVVATIDLPDNRHAVPEAQGEHFVASAHLDLPDRFLTGRDFPDALAALAARHGFSPAADDDTVPAARRPYPGHARMSRDWTAYQPANARGLVARTLLLLERITPLFQSQVQPLPDAA